MSRWRVCIECTEDDGSKHTVARESRWQPKEGTIGEMLCLVNEIAFALCAVEALGIVIGSPDQTTDAIVDGFAELIRDYFYQRGGD